VHVFVDESKAGPYLLVASVVLPGDVHSARAAVRALHLPRQGRIHMKDESDSRRRRILADLERAGLRATIYRAGGYKTDITAREACIDTLIRPLAVEPTARVTFECDQSQDERDRKQLYRLVRELGCTERVQYEHRLATAEPLLAVPDAIGWAYARGGDFRRRATPLIVEVIDV
jgi:hypothetical protein